jgi:predicted ATP-grasp superfamily ATP-dependent carboligase
VLVLADSLLVLHHGSVGIIRSLGRMGVPVYSVVRDRFTPAAVSRYLTGAFICETRGLDARRLLEGMTIIGERLNQPTIVIPTDDVAAIFLAEQAAALQRWFLFPQLPATLPRTLANKKELYLLCNRIGVPCPKALFPNNVADVQDFVKSATFPVVVKAAESWLLPRGARTTSIARSAEQVYDIYQSTVKRCALNLIFQEYIPPAYGEDWFYHGYRNMRSNCSIGFTGRKLRSYPPFSGPTTFGKAVASEVLREQVEAFLQAISYSGIMDLDFRLDKRDGQYKLVDFNPRIGAQFRLFEDAAGIDVARALYLDLTGRFVPRSHPIESRTFIAEFHDVAAGLSYVRQGDLTFRDWWRSLKGTKELAWFCRDDPLPFFMMCTRLFLRVIERLLRLKPAPRVMDRKPSYVRGLRTWFTRRTPDVV